MKIMEVWRCELDVQRYTREIPFRKPQYIIHCIVNGDYSAIQMAYKTLVVLKIKHNLPHIVFLLKDYIKTNANQKTLLTKHQK